MDLFTYIISTDSGFAPNPFWGVCTLALCKPQIRLYARVGDWVAGFASKVRGNGLIYAMEITEKMTLGEYFEFARANLPGKVPKVRYKDRREWLGDAQYDFSTDPPTQLNGRHKPEHRRRDLNGRFVLLSRNYLYFGNQTVKVPERLAEVIPNTQGHRVRANEPFKESFLNWLNGLGYKRNTVLANPFDCPNLTVTVSRGC